jgi:F0F1-type ATP synthase alpha subunit
MVVEFDRPNNLCPDEDAMLGRVVNALGEPVMEKADKIQRFRPIERIASGVVERKMSIRQSRQV